MFNKQLIRLLSEEKGQGMIEYIVINGTVVMAFVLTRAIIVPPLSRLYYLISTMIRLPIS